MNREKFLEAIIEEINGFNDKELKDLNNIFCSMTNSENDMIYDNDQEFFDTFFYDDPMGAIRRAHYGNYTYSESFVKFDGRDNLSSIEYIKEADLSDSFKAIAENVADNLKEYSNLFDVDPDDFEEEEENGN